jgi:hypothetical protein
MHVRGFHRKKTVYVSLFLFFLLLWNGSYAGTGPSCIQQAEEVYNQGIKLYTAGEYLKAIQKFTQVLAVTEDEALLTDTYFHLSLCNYYLKDPDSAKDWVRKVLEAEPGREVSSIYPKGYRDLYDQVKREYAAELEAKRRETKPVESKPAEKPAEEPPPVAVQPGVKKGGGGKTLLYVLGGLVLAGGAAALAMLLGGDSAEEAVSGGSIQVNSNPTGADVFLDGQDTGRQTNTTLTNVPAGSHTLALYKDGYGDYETTVSVTNGATATVDVSLSAHTITVTQPKATSNWTQGEDVEIRWNTGGGSSMSSFIGVSGDARSGLNARGYLVRMNGVRALASQAQGKNAGRRGPATSRAAAAGKGGSVKAASGTAGSLLNPRVMSLNRMAASQNLGDAGTLKPQALSQVRIELYRGDEVERTIAESTDNTGSYEWTVASSLEDGTNYRIRVSAAASPSVYGESPAFIIANLGRIKISSNPTGARIWLGDQDMGVTNKTIEIPVGKYKLLLTKDRYQDWTTAVTVVKNQTANVNATLEAGSFDENFNDGTAEHWESGSTFATWFVENGVYKGKSSHAERCLSYYGLGKGFKNEYTFQAKVKKYSGRSDLWQGIAIGNQDFSRIWVLCIYPGYQFWRIWEMWFARPGDLTGYNLLADGDIDSIIKKTDWNKCKIVVNEKNVTFYINGKQMVSLFIPNLPAKTRIGVGHRAESAGNIVGFDDISLDFGNTAGSTKGKLAVPIPKKMGDA